MNSLTVFNFEYQDVRVAMIDGEPWFCLIDVCSILDISNASHVLERLREDGVVSNEVTDSLRRTQKANFVNEQNLYRLIFQSRKAEARKFQDWVFDSVLPSIRKTGKYEIPAPPFHRTAIEVADAIAIIDTKIGNTNPRLAQILKDYAMNDVLTLPATETVRYRGVVEIAMEMGYKVSLSDRTRLGLFVRNRVGDVGQKKEDRLCNGTQQSIWVYPDTEAIREVVKAFFNN